MMEPMMEPTMKTNMPGASVQPAPSPSAGDIWQSVIADMEARRRLGIERYGVPLQPNNGRDPLIDAYQEALDLAVYLRQAIEERKGRVV